MDSENHKKIIIFRITILILLVAAITSACGSSGGKGSDDLNETEISIIVGKTLAAEELVTSQANETAIPALSSTSESAADSVQKTIDAQQATLDAQATLISQPQVTATTLQESPLPPTEAPTPVEEISLEPIALMDWKTVNMVQAPGCGDDKDGPPCWFGTKAEMSITSRKPILIDPSWPSPHLVFDQRYVFVHDAVIYVNVKGGWEILWSFPAGQSAAWVPFDVDLTKFKGEEILLQMYVAGSSTSSSGKVRVSSWEIRDPRIVPDYTPY